MIDEAEVRSFLRAPSRRLDAVGRNVSPASATWTDAPRRGTARWWSSAALIVYGAVTFSGCAVADGTVAGGTALLSDTSSSSGSSAGSMTSDPCSADAGASNWATLYKCFFGPNSTPSCGATTCHGTSSDIGSAASGFVCGSTADACWQGMTHALSGFTAIVATGGAADATSTPLWQALRKSGTQTAPNNMPLTPATYVFTQPALDRIQAWIQSGAAND